MSFKLTRAPNRHRDLVCNYKGLLLEANDPIGFKIVLGDFPCNKYGGSVKVLASLWNGEVTRATDTTAPELIQFLWVESREILALLWSYEVKRKTVRETMEKDKGRIQLNICIGPLQGLYESFCCHHCISIVTFSRAIQTSERIFTLWPIRGGWGDLGGLLWFACEPLC